MTALTPSLFSSVAPELILTGAGVLILLLEAFVPSIRRAFTALAAVSVLVAGWAAWAWVPAGVSFGGLGARAFPPPPPPPPGPRAAIGARYAAYRTRDGRALLLGLLERLRRDVDEVHAGRPAGCRQRLSIRNVRHRYQLCQTTGEMNEILVFRDKISFAVDFDECSARAVGGNIGCHHSIGGNARGRHQRRNPGGIRRGEGGTSDGDEDRLVRVVHANGDTSRFSRTWDAGSQSWAGWPASSSAPGASRSSCWSRRSRRSRSRSPP